jgi:hypothetical protein
MFLWESLDLKFNFEYTHPMAKRYVVKMFGAIKANDRRVVIEANSLAEAAAKFHATRDRQWMTASIGLEGREAVYSVDSFSRFHPKVTG